jgi:hypothetical protein
VDIPQPHFREVAERVIEWHLLPLPPLHDGDAHRETATVFEIDAPIYTVLLDADGYEDQIIDQAYIRCNLILINHSSSLFQFAHLSVVEYLMTRTVRSDSSQHSYVEVSPQVTISCPLYFCCTSSVERSPVY